MTTNTQNSKTKSVKIQLTLNVSSTALEYRCVIREAYTFAEAQQKSLETTQILKTHLIKTLFINKFAPRYQETRFTQCSNKQGHIYVEKKIPIWTKFAQST
jgi:hypothetical protein